MEKDRTTTGNGRRQGLRRRLTSCFHLKLFAFGLGLVFLLALTATPVYVHYFEPINLSVRDQFILSAFDFINAVVYTVLREIDPHDRLKVLRCMGWSG